jgi:hypothetical protein
MKIRSLALSTFAVAAMAAVTPHALAADTFGFSGTGSTGVSFSGMVTYDPMAAYELTISLTNTTSAAIGGYLTGLAFDLPDGTTIANYTSSHAGMTLETGASVAPFGTRDYAVALGGDWLGGGSPLGGVAAGTNGSWSFDLTNAPGSLTLADLNMAARFRGLSDGGSDKVPAIPEPESWAMMMAGLAALGFVSRRRRDDMPGTPGTPAAA